ncbi:MAG: outer membrane protein assembly factor BamD [SAR86 cluster bacterium]|uniref:Outer membrane protein assembly factor BamD n=1 Tax=SAR86 cluster bacterium TaxID=2030880 RepID=A0A2A5CF29_9GAMM|nr:MAG: outer membrane protein assembly factor BamD [SAR86 cluster bacterium]
MYSNQKPVSKLKHQTTVKRFLSPLLLISIISISACSSDDQFVGSTEEFIYNEAVDALRTNAFSAAIANFQQLEALFPFGQYAAQAQIELVYAYYRAGEAESARAAADRFIRLYPDDENVDYAYYMKGLAFYMEDASILARFLPTDPSKRDPGNARESFTDFAQLITRFPNSPYATDARARMIYLRNLLADYEIHVADFYIERQAFLSALNRARYVVENYQEAPAVPRAMEIMTEMYLRLGLNDLADSNLAILTENYPESGQLNENGEFIVSTQITDPSFLYSVTFGLLGSNKRDTPLAPSRRPESIDTAFGFQLPTQAQVEEKRSLLNILTLGMIGNSGAQKTQEENNEDETTEN